MSRFKARLLVGALVMSLAASACNTGGGGSSGPQINADGSSTVFPITQAVAEEWEGETEAEGVEVSVGTSGTGGGFEKFCAGETDISNASRPIKDEEAKICSDAGIEFVELQVAIDGLSVLVNPGNTFATCLTTQELNAIWAPSSTINNWKDVRAGFPDLELRLYGPGTDSGTFDYFTEVINDESGASRSDYTASEDDNRLVDEISRDPNALGYFGFAYYEQNKDKLKLVGIDSGSGCIEPTVETINGGTYSPLSRPLFIYVAKKSTERPEVRAFLEFYLETVSDLVAEVGYIAVPGDVIETERTEWAAFAG